MIPAGRESWDFDYRPVLAPASRETDRCDVIVATPERVSLERAGEALRRLGAAVRAEEVLDRAPLFWLRVRAPEPIDPGQLAAAFRALGAPPRYVASARFGSQQWAPALGAIPPASADPAAWPARPSSTAPEPRGDGYWFLGAEGGGAAVIREDTGSGAGTRLAVIDDDAAGVSALDLDAEILINLERPPRAQSHGALMVGWAVGAARATPPFRGVAPDASPRLYLIPKPGADALSLPLAVVRAVSDGADVVVCATYIEGSWSAMLDDALCFAERGGRGGRGAVLVLPTGRETSSPPDSVHASLSLSIADAASDPRALCVAPGARRGGWFFYRDRKGRARPFANRGPFVRLLAPGDDIASPLGDGARLSHAESSGASAIAAGVVLLMLAQNPTLELRDVLALLEATVAAVAPTADDGWAPFADAHDTRPFGKDGDGHNAKHGYGMLHAQRACLAAADPIAWALVRIGELAAASAFARLRREDPAVRAAYSSDLGRWIVRVLLADARASHAVRAVVRHARLVSVDARRRHAFPPGSLARHVALILRGLTEGTSIGRPPPSAHHEIEACLERLAGEPSVDAAWIDVAAGVLSESKRSVAAGGLTPEIQGR